MVKFDEQYEVSTREEPRRRASGGQAALPAEDLEVARERRPLESYFQEIGGTRTLQARGGGRPRQGARGGDRGAARRALRDPALARATWSTRWDELRALSHTGAKLSESVGDEETGEIAARVERAVKRLRTLLAAPRPGRAKRRRASEPLEARRRARSRAR